MKNITVIIVILTNLFFPFVNTEIPNETILNTTLYVGGDGPNNYTYIQDAIDNASDGDTIFVYSGIYHENIIVDKSIIILGENAEETIIVGNGYENVVNITTDNAIIKNFGIRNSGSLYAGIGIVGCYNKVINCNISSNAIGVLALSSNNEILNCKFFDNAQAIDMRYSNENIVLNCSILKNGNGVRLYESSLNKIEGCCIAYNTWEGIGIQNSNKSYILNNTFIENGITISGEKVEYFIHEISGNVINNKPLLYYKNSANIKLNGIEAGEIIIVNCKNFVIENISINGSNVGIEVAYSSNIAIKNCSLSNCKNAILFYFSSKNIITENEIEKSYYDGISFYFSSNNYIVKNNVSKCNESGIFLYSSSNNTISENIIRENGGGALIFFNSNYNTISNNRVLYNGGFGISLQGVSFNKVINNEVSYSKYWCGISIVKSYSQHNQIYRNNISHNNWCGIHIEGIENIIRENNITYNEKYGVYLTAWLSECRRNVIAENNFIGNKNNAYFYVNFLSFNIWYRNYWDDWKLRFPKPIFGTAFFQIYIVRFNFPWLNFDVHPNIEKL